MVRELSTLVRGTVVAVVLLAVALASSGCDVLGDGEHVLDGTAWRVSEWADTQSDPADYELTATFSGGEVAGRSAVNSFSGQYRAMRGGEFSVGMLVQTLMAGPEPAMRAEEAYLGFLSQAAAHERDGDTLVLRDEDGTTLLAFVRIR